MLRAIDPATATVAWEFPYAGPSTAGTLSTAGGLVFGGGDGNLIAFDARTGEDLWHFQTGAPITAAPITYLLDGKQYVTVASRGALIAFSLPD
jgi:outer membrane protein assembly factor BamB